MDDSFPTTFDLKKNLKLTAIKAPKSCSNIAVPDELNDYLRDQIFQLKTENESLKEEMLQKDLNLEENHELIDELSSKLREYEGFSSENKLFGTASQVSAATIADLSKKLREKSSEIAVYQTKCTKMEKIIADLENQRKGVQEAEKPERDDEQEQDEKKKLQDKLAHITNKWIEEKNVSLKWRNDLKLAKKWLQQEVGDKFETLLALNSNSNWRGRAQIIQDLQQKNAELKQKLKEQQKGESPKNIVMNRCDFKKLEALTRENGEIKENCEEFKQKFENAKARVRSLETEIALLKTKMASIKEEREQDQNLITTLTTKLSRFNDSQLDDSKHQEMMLKKLQHDHEELKLELERTKCLLENKSREIVAKNDDIDILNKRIRSARPTSSYMNRPENPDSKIIARLEVERMRLLELSEMQNKRLEEERKCHNKTQQTLRIEKQKRTKLEAKLAKQELEENSARSVYSNRSSKIHLNPEDVLKDKLELAEEQVKALTTRLELESLERKSDLQEFAKILNQQNYGLKQ